MDTDTSKTIVRCEKCHHGRWSTDDSECKGCHIMNLPRLVREPLSDEAIERIRINNLHVVRKARGPARIKASHGLPQDEAAAFDEWLRKYFKPGKRSY